MRAINPAPLKVHGTLRHAFDLAVVRRGISTQTAVEEALTLWIAKQKKSSTHKMEEPPLIDSNHPGTLNLTNEEIDTILFN